MAVAGQMNSPAQTPWKSVQNYSTPPEFIEAVKRRFGPITFDLAADEKNALPGIPYLDERRNSLIQPWGHLFPHGNLWLNPPYRDIGPWAEKCALESTMRHGMIFFLTPASIGTGWFDAYVKDKAYCLGLSPRLTFGTMKAPFPKDLMLSIYSCGIRGFDTWRWKP